MMTRVALAIAITWPLLACHSTGSEDPPSALTDMADAGQNDATVMPRDGELDARLVVDLALVDDAGLTQTVDLGVEPSEGARLRYTITADEVDPNATEFLQANYVYLDTHVPR